MTMLTIQLPDHLVARLRASAAARRQPLDTYLSEVLAEQVAPINWLDESLTFDEALAQFQALPPRRIQPATRSLAAALNNTVIDPNFDVAAWNQQWADIEAEIKAADATDSRADQLRDLQ